MKQGVIIPGHSRPRTSLRPCAIDCALASTTPLNVNVTPALIETLGGTAVAVLRDMAAAAAQADLTASRTSETRAMLAARGTPGGVRSEGS